MSEKAIFSTRASQFILDTKAKQWKPVSNGGAFALYQDSAKNTYRIVGFSPDNKPVLMAPIKDDFKLQKNPQNPKWIQFTEARGYVYGINFSKEEDVAKLSELVDNAIQSMKAPPKPSGGPPPPPTGGPPPTPKSEPPKAKSSKKVKLGGGENSGQSRSNLLASIRKGASLKKTETNDRSAPVIDNKEETANTSGGGGGGGGMMGDLLGALKNRGLRKTTPKPSSPPAKSESPTQQNQPQQNQPQQNLPRVPSGRALLKPRGQRGMNPQTHRSPSPQNKQLRSNESNQNPQTITITSRDLENLKQSLIEAFRQELQKAKEEILSNLK
ncbi:vasodilator-stimulated phosphoprotein [Anaeramoeba ignava]|uniref:Vasodilator-stimulated phosphoprotein n=1 Tax=Anaeramoeba ignava TaxID=1746090 RepID=A0A9Q0RCU5_ANAIG|nr:vasodilator-stimulated phosphoprotein [Anaeramoeba ignava]|eukprot:Anaeramoba_ignava/c14305_g1_i2.p1 GENE.c14305_g1_i2~~c14305_g1_i2.p1  ORF type:complete len:327 (-),score=129.91 c14305_g1_i2:58-1038(-)